jgi:DNA repair exonuclease SbcCD ATPase subunit
MTDKALKTLIEESAGVEVLTEAYAEARKRALAAETAQSVARSTRDNAMDALKTIADEIKAAEEQKALFESQRKDRAKAELAKIPPINAQIVENTKKRGELEDEAMLEKRIAACQAKLDGHKAEQKILATHKEAVAKKEREIATAMGSLTGGKRGLEAQQKMLAEIESQIGKPCGECGKTYCEHDLEAAKAARVKTINEQKAGLLPIAQAIRTAQEELKALQEAATKFEASMTDVSEVARENTRLNSVLNEVRALTRHSTTLGYQINTIKEAAKAHLEAENPWQKVENAARVKQGNAELRLKDAEVALGKAVTDNEIAQTVAKVYGPAGVRAHILDTVTPILNDQTSDYLGILADGNIHATWNTLAKTAKGELKEKFNIEVTNDKGAKSFAGLSGGEKRKARLASSMALQDMVATRATKPINLFVADEVDHALDEAGLERLMTVLERKARERGTVVVISHNSLADWCDQVIVAEKSGGLTQVTGANVRGS